MPVKLFYFHAAEDANLCKELDKRLYPLEQQGQIDVWHPGLIAPGQVPEEEIRRNLDSANIILILISPDLLYTQDGLLKEVLNRYEKGVVRVIPLLLRPTHIKGTGLSRFKVLPSNGVPITSWDDADEAWNEVIVLVSEQIQPATTSKSTYPRVSFATKRYATILTLIMILASMAAVLLLKYEAGYFTSDLMNCKGVVIDDVFTNKENDEISLDVRIRNSGSRVVNITRAIVFVLSDEQKSKEIPIHERYIASDNYKKKGHFSAGKNVFAVAHKLNPGEVDRFIIQGKTNNQKTLFRGFIKLIYNGVCSTEEKEFLYATPAIYLVSPRMFIDDI